MAEAESQVLQTNAQIFLRFLKFGFLAWGGPVAQLAMIRQELVEEEKWITREKFNRALAVYQVLPGPEAHEMCVYFGMIAGGRIGGFLAGLGFMLPGFLLMLLLTWIYVQFGVKSPIVQSVFVGLQVAVIALIVRAIHRIGSHALLNYQLFLAAILSFIAYFLGTPFLLVLLAAGLGYMFWMKKQVVLAGSVCFILIAACLYFYSPVNLFPEPLLTSIGNSVIEKQESLWYVLIAGLKGGLLTFGGAYTAIPFLQQDAVLHYGWMTNEQFLDGIALSGILPAPLIIFSTFVGYFGGGWTGAILITVAIFLPAFLFTLVGHGMMEKLIHNTRLHFFLEGVTAGVIGLISVTAVQLLVNTVSGAFALVVFSVSLVMLYLLKSKLAVVYVLIAAGLLGLIQFLF